MVSRIQAASKLLREFFQTFLSWFGARVAPYRGAESGVPAEVSPEPVLRTESVNPTAPAGTPAVPTEPLTPPVEWKSKEPLVEKKRRKRWQKKKKPDKRQKSTHARHFFVEGLLPIDDCIPPGIDSRCVKAVLVWGFMRPARENKLINGNYSNSENVLAAVVGKGYPQDGVRQAMKWLEKTGVITCPHPVKGKKILSLSTRVSTAPWPNGKKIIGIVSHALYQLQRMNHGKDPATRSA